MSVASGGSSGALSQTSAANHLNKRCVDPRSMYVCSKNHRQSARCDSQYIVCRKCRNDGPSKYQGWLLCDTTRDQLTACTCAHPSGNTPSFRGMLARLHQQRKTSTSLFVMFLPYMS
eukprot:scaffold93471_cov17-Tisochrysis_lutea.AAC.2